MVHLIDKDALIAKILRLKGLLLKGACASQISMQANCKEEAYNETLSILDTLEVKEVDFDAEWEKYFEHRGEIASINVKHLAKHFFELVPKQEWNEEDELHIRELESLVKQEWAKAERENDRDKIHKMSDLSFFLKTLKPQLKQEWSEEDENGLGDALWAIKQARTIAKDENDMGTLWYAERWLKTIKEKYQRGWHDALEKQGEQKQTDKVEPFNKYEGLTDFERTLADICIGWIGEELGWEQYIKDNADVLLKIAIEKFNSVHDKL